MLDASKFLEGMTGVTGVIRVDLSESELKTIEAITIVDDGVVSGGSGIVPRMVV